MTEDVLTLAKTRFKHCSDYESDNRNNALDDLEFSEGEQWPSDIKEEREKKNLPCLVINKVPLYVRQIVNDIRQVRPSIKVRPVDSQADPETAEVLNGMIRAIEQDSSAESAYDWAAEYAVRAGVGYWRIMTDYCDDNSFDQDIRIKRIRNVFSVYIDPSAEDQDGSDAKFAFVVEKMPKKDFEAQYPEATSEWKEGSSEHDREWWFGETHVRVAEYWEVVEDPITLYLVLDPMTGQQIVSEEPPPDPALVIHTREATKRRVVQRLITGAEVLKETQWPGKYIPIVRCLGREIDIEGEVRLKGMVRDIKDPARQYNYFRSVSIERAASATKPQWIGPKGAFKSRRWNDANMRNYPFLEWDTDAVLAAGGTPPTMTPAPDISPGFANEVATAAEEYKSVTGIYDAGIGARSNEVSGVAIDSRRSESDVSNFDFVDNLARAMAYAGKILVDLIPKIYTGPRIVRILRPGGEEEAVQVNAPYIDDKQRQKNFQLEVGKYDVSVDVGPSYATQRQEASESMLEFLRVFPQAAQVTGDLLTKNFDWPEADEISKRLKLLMPPEILQDENPAFKQILMQKDQQIQQLQQQMQMMLAEGQQLVQQLQNKEAETQIKQEDLARKWKKDLTDHIEGMTKLEIDASKDLGPQGRAY